MVDYISYLTNPSSDRLILTTKLWLGRQEWIQKSWKVEGNCHVAVSRWLFRIRMNWIISVLSRRYFVFLFIWNLKYWDNNNVSYIKIDLFFRYPQLVLSSLPTDLVNAKYIFYWKSFQTKRFTLTQHSVYFLMLNSFQTEELYLKLKIAW